MQKIIEYDEFKDSKMLIGDDDIYRDVSFSIISEYFHDESAFENYAIKLGKHGMEYGKTYIKSFVGIGQVFSTGVIGYFRRKGYEINTIKYLGDGYMRVTFTFDI